MSRYQAELRSAVAVGRELGQVAQAIGKLLWTMASVTAHVIVAAMWFAFIGGVAVALLFRVIK